MIVEQAATDSTVEVEICGQTFNVSGTHPPGSILEVAEYVEAMVYSTAEQNPQMDGNHLVVLAAFNIAEENHLLKTRLADGNRKRRQEYYTKHSHEQLLLALVNDQSLPAKERKEALHDLGRLRGYYRRPAKR